MDKFKDSLGRWRTQTLFVEYKDRTGKYEFFYTLKDYDNNGVASLKHLYLDLADPTEYLFAAKYLGGWEHWQKMVNNSILREEIDKWRLELEIKIKAEAIKAIAEISNDKDDKGRLSAAKWIAEKGWEPKRGRPTKAEVEKEKKIHAGVTSYIDKEYDRLINGKKAAH